jgi:hypothetical protein
MFNESMIQHHLDDALSSFRAYKKLAEKALEQLNEEEFFATLDEESNREDLLAYWQRGWQCVFAALEPLRAEDFEQKVKIRGEEHSVIQAIDRQMTHYAYHIGQIVFLAKHFRSAEWQSLSIPRNRSAEFNRYLNEGSRKADTEHRFDVGTKFRSGIEKEKH